MINNKIILNDYIYDYNYYFKIKIEYILYMCVYINY